MESEKELADSLKVRLLILIDGLMGVYWFEPVFFSYPQPTQKSVPKGIPTGAPVAHNSLIRTLILHFQQYPKRIPFTRS